MSARPAQQDAIIVFGMVLHGLGAHVASARAAGVITVHLGDAVEGSSQLLCRDSGDVRRTMGIIQCFRCVGLKAPVKTWALMSFVSAGDGKTPDDRISARRL